MHMKEFADFCYKFVHGKNDSWNRHVQYIRIGETIKNHITYCLPPTSSLFSNFPDVIHVEKLSASQMILKEAQFMEILVC